MEKFIETYMRNTIHLCGTWTERPGNPNCFDIPELPKKCSWHLQTSVFYGKAKYFEDRDKIICLAIPIKEDASQSLSHGRFTMSTDYFFLMQRGAYVLNIVEKKWDLLSEAVGLPKDIRNEFLVWKGKKM